MTILLIFLAVLALAWFAVWSTADQDYVPSAERARSSVGADPRPNVAKK